MGHEWKVHVAQVHSHSPEWLGRRDMSTGNVTFVGDEGVTEAAEEVRYTSTSVIASVDLSKVDGPLHKAFAKAQHQVGTGESRHLAYYVPGTELERCFDAYGLPLGSMSLQELSDLIPNTEYRRYALLRPLVAAFLKQWKNDDGKLVVLIEGH